MAILYCATRAVRQAQDLGGRARALPACRGRDRAEEVAPTGKESWRAHEHAIVLAASASTDCGMVPF